LYVENIQVVRL